MEAPMRHILMSLTVVTVFTFGMGASMAQQPQQMDPGTIKVTPPVQTPPVQTRPSTPPNLNTSKNPYDTKPYMRAPVPQPDRR
jgi:hypothetical protein